MNTSNEVRKDTRKPSRTLVLSGDKSLDLSTMEGLLSNSKNNNAFTFLEFDTVDNAVKVYNYLREEKVRVKYCYYKLFVKFTTSVKNLSYDELKEKVKETVGGQVLYFKLYTKNEELIGSGDFTVDTLADFKRLLKQKFEVKLNDTDVSFEVYRYRITQKKKD